MANLNQTTTIYEKLKSRIERGDYSPAESLLEIELASEYNVSRGTVKKALLMLKNDDLVTIKQNKGTKVRSYSKKEVLDFLELRVELEGFIVRLAVPCFTEKNMQDLETIHNQMSECLNKHDLMGFSALNHQFHAIIYHICPNKTTMDLMIHLKKQMSKYDAKTILVPGRGEDSFKEHGTILEAIKQSDVAAAETCMRVHLSNVRKAIEEYYFLLF